MKLSHRCICCFKLITIACHCRTAEENKSIFLRVDIVLHGATFFIVFSDADHMPPPYRIDNFSEVKIKFHLKCGSKVLVFIRDSTMLVMLANKYYDQEPVRFVLTTNDLKKSISWRNSMALEIQNILKVEVNVKKLN